MPAHPTATTPRLPRTRRVLPWVALLILTSGFAAACSSDLDEQGATFPSVSPIEPAVTGTPTPSAPGSDAATPQTPALEGRLMEPVATFDVRGDDPHVLARLDSLTVIGSTQRLVALRDDGREVWKLPRPRRASEPARPVLGLVDGVVIAAWDLEQRRGDPFTGLMSITAVDPRTGKSLWRDDESSFVTLGDGVVLTSQCFGEQKSFVGDCVLSARDPRTGAPRWSVPTYASARVDEIRDDGDLLVESHPADYRPSLQVHSAATGAPLTEPVTARVTPLETGYLAGGYGDDDSEDGCTQRVRFLDLDGRARWQARVPSLPSRTEPGTCYPAYARQVAPGGPVAVQPFLGRTSLFDLADGSLVWRGEREEEARLLVGDLLVSVQTTNGYARTTLLTDVDTGQVRWTLPTDRIAVGPDLVNWESFGRQLLASTEGFDLESTATVIVVPRTGRVLRRYPGAFDSAEPDWIATTHDTSVFVYDR